VFLKDAQKAPVEHSRSGGPGSQYVIYKPVAVKLPEGCITKEAGGEKHLMGGLEHSLQMRRISLGQRELVGKRGKGYSPGHHPFFSRDFEQAVKSSGYGIGQ